MARRDKGPTSSLRGLARRSTIVCALGAASVATAIGARAADAELVETGSSLLFPLFNLWIPAYQSSHPGVKITPHSTGSGAGISQAISGAAQIGASDAYMSQALAKQRATMMNIPLVISSQTVAYNLPDFEPHLRLSGPVIAEIYEGKITDWNDEKIKKLNPGTDLPDQKIITVHRTDGSGDTFIFTQFLSTSAPEWGKSLGFGTTVSWPAVPGGLGAEGNPGMVEALKNNPYAIAYVGSSFKKTLDDNKLGEAALENRAAKFVLPDAEAVKAAAAALSSKTPEDGSISLIFSPGANSYPIINYEYAVVNRHQSDPSMAAEIKAFLTWVVAADHGNAVEILDKVNFVPLPPEIAKASQAQIDKIGSK